MPKEKIHFFCTNCGFESLKWEGKCQSCGEWNTFQEHTKSSNQNARKSDSWTDKGEKEKSFSPIQSISHDDMTRLTISDREFHRVLGGGIVLGSVILIGGEPGIGKSTLLLQLAIQHALRIVYISGEESAAQIKMRADRIGIKNEDCFISTEQNILKALKEAKNLRADFVIIDSIQTMYSTQVDNAQGSIPQIRECTAEIQRFAKKTNVPVLIIGHITKEGNIAGPKLLEHIVDVVLQFEGDQNYTYRILRSIKNRFGSTDEIGMYEMHSQGLRGIENPSELLIDQRSDVHSGTAVSASVQGRRSLLMEVQALVTPAIYGTPQRSVTGLDIRRLHMLLAVLEKRCGIHLGNQDVFINIVGGIKINEPAFDLSLCAAILSSSFDQSIPKGTCFCGEVGLSGEVRSVRKLEQRINEASRLGFEHIYIPSAQFSTDLKENHSGVRLLPIPRVQTLLDQVFTVS